MSGVGAPPASVRSHGQLIGALGPGFEAAVIGAALVQLSRDPEVERMVLFGSWARGDARPDSDLDLLISDEATAQHWAGSRWHVLGHIQREVVPLDDRDPIRTPAEFWAEQGGLGMCSMEAASRCGCIQLGSRGTPSARAAACRARSRLARGRPRRNASSR